MPSTTRRAFLIGGSAIGGALIVGTGYLSSVDTLGLAGAQSLPDGTQALNAWVSILPDGRVEFAIPRTEMGQGVHTALPMLVAEELGVALTAATVRVIHPTEPLSVYTNFVLALNKRPEDQNGVGDWLGRRIVALVPFIGTGGSTSIVASYEPLRRVGAAARSMLEKAAAARFGIPRSRVEATGMGSIRNCDTGETISYAALAEAATQQSPDLGMRLKPRKDFRVIGKSHPRLDIPAKTRGEAHFGIDARPDTNKPLLHAAIRISPVFGGQVASLDAESAAAMPGVKKVVNLGDAVAVIAETTWHAKRALDRVAVRFEGGDTSLNNSSVKQVLATALEEAEVYTARHDGDVDTAIADAADVLDAIYEVPYLAHATMEPMNATALYQDGQVTMWASSQVPMIMHWAADETLKPAKGTEGHVMMTGGGFGRRSEKDSAYYAAKLAGEMPGYPVKLVFSREEDMRHDMYRPAARMRMRAALKGGIATAFDFKTAVQSVNLSFSRRNLPVEQGGVDDPSSVEGAVESAYAFPNFRVAAAAVDLPIPVGYWRSVGHSQNAFAVESFVDEIAQALGEDPFDMRQRLLADHPRLAPLAAELRRVSDYDARKAAGASLGVTIHQSFRSFVGQVAEVSIDGAGALSVEHVHCVIDCGVTVNPDTIVAQMEGSIIFGMTAAMYGEVSIENGAVVTGNFPDYDMLRLANTPGITVTIMQNTHAPGGVGEPGTPPIFAALTNAVHAASGQRIRALPLQNHGYYFA